MRAIGWLLLLLLAIGWLAAEVPRLTEPQWAPVEDTWRRTSNGWQRATWLADPALHHRPRLHPTVVASFELLASALALVAFAPVARENRARRDSGRNPFYSKRLRHSAAAPSG
jgi:hypothetical protein